MRVVLTRAEHQQFNICNNHVDFRHEGSYKMLLHRYVDRRGNFGDDLNDWIWPMVFGRPLNEVGDPDALFLGIGTILNSNIPKLLPRKVVLGSGCGYGQAPTIDKSWRILGVRGPLTAKLLNLGPNAVVGDAAYLIADYVAQGSGGGGPAFMPHHLTAEHHGETWREACEQIGLRYIDPANEVTATVSAIADSDLVVTEAMHGAIVADALGIPWIPAKTSPRVLEFKWIDWCQTIGVAHAFLSLTPESLAAALDIPGRQGKRRLVESIRGRLRSATQLASIAPAMPTGPT